jgi:hypothetical protein
LPGTAGVLGGDEIHGGEDFSGSRAEIADISDRRRDDVERGA